jgi:hypothetical protein
MASMAMARLMAVGAWPNQGLRDFIVLIQFRSWVEKIGDERGPTAPLHEAASWHLILHRVYLNGMTVVTQFMGLL